MKSETTCNEINASPTCFLPEAPAGRRPVTASSALSFLCRAKLGFLRQGKYLPHSVLYSLKVQLSPDVGDRFANGDGASRSCDGCDERNQ